MEVMRLRSKGWQGRNNVEVEIVPCGRDGELATAADVWVIAPAELARWTAADRLAPVPDELQQTEDPFAWNGLLALYREHLLRWDHTAYALPLVGEAPLCCYRSDLFKDAQLKPPATWKDVADAAEYFAKASGTASLPPLPADDDGLEREFYSVAAGYAHRALSDPRANRNAFSFHYDYDAPAMPRIDGPGFVRALALLQRLQPYRAKSDDSPVAAFRRGTGVFCLTDAAEVFRLQERGSAVRDKFTVARVPAAEVCFAHAAKAGDEPLKVNNWVPYFGAAGWLGVVPKTSEHTDEAFGLLAELAGPDLSRQVVLSPRANPPLGGGAFRSDHFDRNARWEAFDLDAPRTAALKEVVQQTLEHRSVANPVYRLRTPDERERRVVLTAGLRKALIAHPAADPARVLSDVATQWKQMDKANPKFLDEYRLGIGF
jgi:ABC-type glycerol-3-phosphate transport system substrate-binding protein